MLIDWFTVIAQVVNFLILVWLLKRLLYKPILNAIDAREQRIAAVLADADTKQAEARKERDEFLHKNEAFEQQRVALLTQATGEAAAARVQLLTAARTESDDLRAKQQQALRNEQQSLSETLGRSAQQEVFAIARKALADLATSSLEERLTEVFLRRLLEIDSATKTGLAEALKTTPDPALLRSAFDLPAEQRALIQNALNETFSAQINVRFETAPELISGIELSKNGQKVAWSIADYLKSLQQGIDEILKTKGKPAAKDAPENRRQ